MSRDDTELTVLRTLYRLTAAAICEHEGHEYERVGERADITLNSLKVERCARCGDTRTGLFESATTAIDPGDITFTLKP